MIFTKNGGAIEMRRIIYRDNDIPQDTFTVSISDLMSGLLAIFILVLSYFILNFSQATAQLTQNDVSGAIGSLQALVEDLQDAVDDLHKERRRD